MNWNPRGVWRTLSVALVAILAFSPVSASSLSVQQPPDPQVAGAEQILAPLSDAQALTAEQALDKLYPSLRGEGSGPA